MLLGATLLAAVLLAAPKANAQPTPQANLTANQQPEADPCETGDTAGCLKAAAAGLLPALAVPRRLPIWPGLSLTSGGFPLEPPPPLGARVDGYLVRGLRAFVSSLALKVKVVDSQVGLRLAKLSRAFAESAVPLDQDGEGEDTKRADATGRRKKVNNALLMGGLMMAGMMLAMAMAGISALAGKALITSLLSLGMTLMTRNGNGNGNGKGGGGGGHEKTTYEIVHTMPSHHPDDYSHRQWADVTHEGYHVVKTH